MKKLHAYLVRSFIGPFILTFCITLFVLLMQFLWKYIDDMVGKGLEWGVLLQLVTYWSASLVPLALPLAVLLSSIMTFGNFGEHFELNAVKSSGVSLLRFMMPLIVGVIMLSGAALWFSDKVMPVAQLKAISLLYDIKKKKPTFNLNEGYFNNDIEGFSLKVGSKDEDGKTLYDLLLYDHTAKDGNRSVIVAERGEFYMTSDERALILKLYNGYQYKEMDPSEPKKKDYPHYRTQFGSWEKRFDMQQFDFKRTQEDLFKQSKRIKNIRQLTDAVDTVYMWMDQKVTRFGENIQPYVIHLDPRFSEAEPMEADSIDIDLSATGIEMLAGMEAREKRRLFTRIFNQIRQVKGSTNTLNRELHFHRQDIAENHVELNRKYTLSIACLLMFFVGAPLGAIIRKGGLGWPLFWAIIIFIIFHVSSIIGEKMAEEMKLSAFTGMWMSSFILAPMGIFLTIKAKNDSSLLNMDAYQSFFNSIARKLRLVRNDS